MSEKAKRYVWRVTHQTGDVEYLCQLKSVRRNLVAPDSGAARRTLTRVDRGCYYYVDSYQTPKGRRPSLVLIEHIRASVAELEKDQGKLPFDATREQTAAELTARGV